MEIKNHNVKLQWALVNGKLKYVSDFAHLKPKDRPEALCPVCNMLVTMKLGKKNTHHCAHTPGSNCITTLPESALHLNTKFHLYNELRNGRSLFLLTRCQYCLKSSNYLWKTDWDDVKVEYSVGSRRPDIALLLKGKIIGAIEVLVTHEVDEEKAKDFAANNIPWIEVIATPDLYSEPDPWTTKIPLDPSYMEPEIEWICPSCKKEETQREYRRKNRSKPILTRIVDFYYPSGGRFRSLYFITEKLKDGSLIGHELLDFSKGKILAFTEIIDKKEAFEILHKQFNSTLSHYRNSYKAITDSPMNWKFATDIILSSDFVVYGDIHYPRRYIWSYKYSKWFCPPDKRIINWDMKE